MFLYVPNYDSASRLLMGADAHFIWPTHHLNYYTPDDDAGPAGAGRASTPVYVATEGLDIVDYLWYRREVHGAVDGVAAIADVLQFLINAGAYGKNLRVIAGRRQPATRR